MTYKVFRELYIHACLSTDFNEFARSAREVDGFTEDLAETGMLFSIWLYSVDTSSTKVREFAGTTRAQFCRDYGLQERTVANWDLKKTDPPEWALHLLCYAVLNRIYEEKDTARANLEIKNPAPRLPSQGQK